MVWIARRRLHHEGGAVPLLHLQRSKFTSRFSNCECEFTLRILKPHPMYSSYFISSSSSHFSLSYNPIPLTIAMARSTGLGSAW